MIVAPSFTTVPNADNTSVDITLGAMPPSATRVLLYTRTVTGYDNLVHTFTGAGSFNDDNSGSGYGKFRVLWYQATADDGPSPTDWSYSSREVMEQVGTNRRLLMGALINQVKDLIDNDAALLALGYKPREYFVDPQQLTSLIYIIPGEERPDLRYANKLVESEMDVELQVTTTCGVGRTGWERNEDAVNRMIDILHLQQKEDAGWGCKGYKTMITSVQRNSEEDGDQPQNPVTRILFTVTTQYAKFIP